MLGSAQSFMVLFHQNKKKWKVVWLVLHFAILESKIINKRTHIETERERDHKTTKAIWSIGIPIATQRLLLRQRTSQ